MFQPPPSRSAVLATGGYLLVWAFAVLDGYWWTVLPRLLSISVLGVGFPLTALWIWWVWRNGERVGASFTATCSLGYFVCWQSAVLISGAFVWDTVRVNLSIYGCLVFFFVGLAWVVWGVEKASRYFQRRHKVRVKKSGRIPAVWNPLDLDAWFYGNSKKLNQSMTALLSYSMLFLFVLLTLGSLKGCREIYEMPAGGGEPKTIAQTIKIQKIIRKKYVVNPYSAILFDAPPIDDVKLQLTEITKHAYKVGYGQGTGAGFAGGTARGKVRFIRLEYSGGDWDQDFGIGADLNMLIEYGVRTSHTVAKRTESRRVAELSNFPAGKSPPVVYMTGQRNISLSNSEVKILREYLIDKHGMIFADNGGSRHFHNQFLSMMNRVLPDVRPVPVPLDDVIHRVPYQIPFLPYVAPHGGKEALGWYLDGRWLGYYHPGDIGDAWCDGHAGVKPEVWEACYQLGVNVLFYAHAEHSKWLEAVKQRNGKD